MTRAQGMTKVSIIIRSFLSDAAKQGIRRALPDPPCGAARQGVESQGLLRAQVQPDLCGSRFDCRVCAQVSGRKITARDARSSRER